MTLSLKALSAIGTLNSFSTKDDKGINSISGPLRGREGTVEMYHDWGGWRGVRGGWGERGGEVGSVICVNVSDHAAHRYFQTSLIDNRDIRMITI